MTQEQIALAPSFTSRNPSSKRILDIVGAVVLLVVLSPLWIVIGILILCDSGGPIFFRQEREGCGRTFLIIKFRTMRGDDTHLQETPNDPRVTRVGRYLRRFSLDEIPQLLNVMMGEMSLIGPRPHALWHGKMCQGMPNYHLRYRMRPGLTGLAQVKGLRGAVYGEPLMERIACDLYYIENWSMRLDIKILLRTIPALWSGDGD